MLWEKSRLLLPVFVLSLRRRYTLAIPVSLGSERKIRAFSTVVPTGSQRKLCVCYCCFYWLWSKGVRLLSLFLLATRKRYASVAAVSTGSEREVCVRYRRFEGLWRRGTYLSPPLLLPLREVKHLLPSFSLAMRSRYGLWTMIPLGIGMRFLELNE